MHTREHKLPKVGNSVATCQILLEGITPVICSRMLSPVRQLTRACMDVPVQQGQSSRQCWSAQKHKRISSLYQQAWQRGSSRRPHIKEGQLKNHVVKRVEQEVMQGLT